jgi:hypothetical protein
MRFFLVAMLMAVSMSAHSLVTFSPGGVATAADFNSNFSELDSAIGVLESAGGGSSGGDGYVDATVNGVTMKVLTETIGSYNVKTPTGLTVSVDADGYPNIAVYYQGNNCTGTPYYRLNLNTDNRTVGYVYANPLISTATSILYDGSQVFYTTGNVIKLNYQSSKSNWGCNSNPGVIAALKALPNDPAITGVQSFPLVITGIGTTLSITQEVGTVTTGSFDVFANGVKIGTTDRYPRYADSALYSVILDGFRQQSITLYKNGTYNDRSRPQKSLYYISTDCSGTAYAEVLGREINEWWTGSLTLDYVQNDGNLYDLSATIYKSSTNRSGSYLSSYNGTCYTSTTAFSTLKGYKVAVLSSAVMPAFATPITIEGYTEETPRSNLPEVY